MKITPKNPLVIRDDWATTPGGFVYADNGSQMFVTITVKPGTPTIPGRPAVPAITGQPEVKGDPTAKPPVFPRPAIPARAAIPAVAPVAATPATQAYNFILWTGADYTAANAMNGGNGWYQADMNSAIAAHLTALTTA